ncbi:hypothetical protein CR157_20425 [Halomonas sp. LBP4]|nr:hypothetical protein CR157_20425 [Halomonas sp. LBP4]
MRRFHIQQQPGGTILPLQVVAQPVKHAVQVGLNRLQFVIVSLALVAISALSVIGDLGTVDENRLSIADYVVSAGTAPLAAF